MQANLLNGLVSAEGGEGGRGPPRHHTTIGATRVFRFLTGIILLVCATKAFQSTASTQPEEPIAASAFYADSAAGHAAAYDARKPMDDLSVRLADRGVLKRATFPQANIESTMLGKPGDLDLEKDASAVEAKLKATVKRATAAKKQLNKARELQTKVKDKLFRDRLFQVADVNRDDKISLRDAFALADLNRDGQIDQGDLLELAERLAVQFTQMVKVPTTVLQSVGGAALLLYGKNFASSVLFFQAFQATGWPTVQRAIGDFKISYVRAREATKAEMPKLQHAKEVLPQLLKETREAKQALRSVYKFERQRLARLAKAQANVAKATAAMLDGSGTRKKLDEAKQEVQKLTGASAKTERLNAQASKELNDAQRCLNDVMTVTSSLKQIADAANPTLIGDALGGVVSGITGCIAAATGPVPRAACVGKALGGQIAEKIAPLVNATMLRCKSPQSFADWGACLASSACTAGAALGAVKVSEVTLVVSACAIGSHALAEGVCRQLSETTGVQIDKKTRDTIEVALTAVGTAFQIRGGGKLPILAEAALAPMLGLEAYLKAQTAWAAAEPELR